VNTVMFWILCDLASASKDLDTAPPIQSRMYQELSNGMLGFSNCLKIADVPFPFPYSQLLTLLLTVYACFIPVYIVCFTESLIASPILAFLLFEGIWGVNEVAKELENPFGSDDNDISLADFHARFLDVIGEVKPVEGSDSSAGASTPAVKKASDASTTKQAAPAPAAVKLADAPTNLTSPAPLKQEEVVIGIGELDSLKPKAFKAGGDVVASRTSLSTRPSTLGSPMSSSSVDFAMSQAATAEPPSPAPVPPLPGPAAAPAAAASASAAEMPGDKASPAPEKVATAEAVQLPPPPPPLGITKVIDDNLALINARMEQHLMRMSRNLEVLSNIAIGWDKE